MAEAGDEEELSTPLIAELYKPPALLPIAQLKDPLLYAIETFPVTIIVSYLLAPERVLLTLVPPKVGETGSGKTSKYLAFARNGRLSLIFV